MTDVLTPKQRSYAMSQIRGKDTKPELVLRKSLHALGFRYGLHSSNLPGKPDLVFRRYGAVCFVNGCFWHRHSGCRYMTTPANRQEFWEAKFDANVARDRRDQSRLMDTGWRVAVIWECQLKRHQLPDTVHQLSRWITAGSISDREEPWSPRSVNASL
ncbi:very short patch repair endonuclease [Salinisphaera orenii]|uniref:very short patch repair endonuclease n=1 Tax=Salinisphaera orenii TaxID=856731 RepID=UPI000DBE88E1